MSIMITHVNVTLSPGTSILLCGMLLTVRLFMASDISGTIMLSGQANQSGAVLPSYRIMIASFEGHSVNITIGQSIHDLNQVTHYTRKPLDF
jgi:hypothetical protein